MGSTSSKPDKIIQYVGSEETKGETRPFRSLDAPASGELGDKLPGGISNMLACFETMREKLGPKPLYGTRVKIDGKPGPYNWRSYDDVYKIVTSLAKCFISLSLMSELEYVGKKLKAVGIFCKTREEWVYTWISCWYSAASIVPLYDTLGEESIEWIVNQTELKCIVTTSPYVGKVCKLKAEGKLATLKTVIILDPISKEETEEIKKSGLQMLMLQECIEIGQKSTVELKLEVRPDTIATVCYTSGTTSRPKGVMLTHRNYVSMALGIISLPFVRPTKDSICICWLPLAHVFEQFVVVCMLAMGVKVGFFSGDIAKLSDDMQVLKPYFFGSVPRVFNKIYEQSGIEIAKLTGFRKKLYERAVAVKQYELRRSGKYTHWFYDRFVFKKISQKLGGSLGIIFVGGAPLTPDVLEMSRIWLGCGIVQGYGQTETAGPIIAQCPDDTYPASIGAPMPHAEAKLVDVPEMKYFSTDMTDGKQTPRGEIWVRSAAIAAGYWKEPEMTKETFTEDGWVKTGDIATMSPAGHLVIIDRKKHIFKLAQVILHDVTVQKIG